VIQKQAQKEIELKEVSRRQM